MLPGMEEEKQSNGESATHSLLHKQNGCTEQTTEKQNGAAQQTINDKECAPTQPKGFDLASFTPPDGGWGWLVVLASFWTNGTLFGTLNSFGILYVKLLDEFQTGDEDISFKTCRY